VDIAAHHLLVRALPPLHRHALRRPLPSRCRHRLFGFESTRFEPCSDRVVSHHLAGLLRRSPRHRGCREPAIADDSAESRGLVASRCQSWGSPRFSVVAPVARSGRRSRDAPTPRRIPPILSRTVSPRPLPSCRSLAALLGPRGFAFPLAPFNPHPAVSVGFKALLSGWVRTTVRRFRRPMAYPPVGFYVPFKVLRSRCSACAAHRDEQPTRFRGPVAVPAEHIPVGSAAALLKRREAIRRALFRCPPHHRRSRENGGESVVRSRTPEGAVDGANASDHRRLEEAVKLLRSVWTIIRLESLDLLPHESHRRRRLRVRPGWGSVRRGSVPDRVCPELKLCC